jgi:hypothetical protein
MNRWYCLALLFVIVVAAAPARAADSSAKSAQPKAAGPVVSSEVSRQQLFDIPHYMLELGVGGGFRKRSWLAFEGFAVLGRGYTENGLKVTTLGPHIGVDFSFWKLHIEPMAGANLIEVDRITSGSSMLAFPWVLALRAGPSFSVGESHLAIDLDLRLNMLSIIPHPGYGLRVRYQFF